VRHRTCQTAGIQENTTGLKCIFSDFFIPKTVPSVEIVIMEGCPGTTNKNLPLVLPLTCVVALLHGNP
jgi:hypothetical protein